MLSDTTIKHEAHEALLSQDPELALELWEKLSDRAHERGGDHLSAFLCFKAQIMAFICPDKSVKLFELAWASSQTVGRDRHVGGHASSAYFTLLDMLHRTTSVVAWSFTPSRC